MDGSHRNYFVGNSFTHGGDGFFLTDRVNGGFDRATGVFKFEGSSNNNVIAYNDGSWSPANAFEGTFSFGNIYYRNWCNDSRYGFWLGYSSDSLISRNEIWRSTADAIAVEQGANNKIEFNEIVNTGLSAVHLWSGDRPEHATRPSTRNVILGNLIRNAESAYSLERSTETALAGNQVHGAKLPENVQTSTAATSSTTAFERSPEHSKVMSLLARRPAGWLYYREMGRPLGLKWVEPEEFAPRDFRNDIVAWRRVNESELEIEGVRPQPVSFKHSPKVALVPAAGNRAAWFVKPALPEDGIGGFFDPQIVATSAGRSQQINATLFSARWQVRYYHWDKDALKPEDTAGWNRLFASEPVHQSQQNQIAGDFSFKPQATGLRTEYWAFEAITQVRLEAGTYEFNALPDDGLQVWAGDQKVIDAWRSTPGNLSGRVSLPAGVHTIRVRFMQTWGHTYLQFAFRKV